MLDAAIWRRGLQWTEDGHKIAVAIVIKTWGSAPCPAGSRLFARADGQFTGSVSSGCIESEVINAAVDIANAAPSQAMSFGVTNETAWQQGLSCGGEIDVFIHALNQMQIKASRALLAAQKKRINGVLLTHLSSGAQYFFTKENNEENNEDYATDDSLLALARAALDKSPSPYLQDGYFIEPSPPSPRLLIIGATHITQALLPLAEAVGFLTIVIDPRAAWGAAHVANARCEWPDTALADIKIGAADAVITLTHDTKIDDPALLLALAASPFYIGALGSRRTHQKRLRRLTEAGAKESSLSRIHGPVGLAIGARAPSEIAVSIMAQVIQAYRQQ